MPRAADGRSVGTQRGGYGGGEEMPHRPRTTA